MKYIYRIPHAIVWTAVLIVTIPFLVVGVLLGKMVEIGGNR